MKNTFNIKKFRKILEETIDEYAILYRKGPFILKEDKLKTKNHKYRTDKGYIDEEKEIIVINYLLSKEERAITLNHELIHGKFPNLSENKVEKLALELFNKYSVGYDFYKPRKKR